MKIHIQIFLLIMVSATLCFTGCSEQKDLQTEESNAYTGGWFFTEEHEIQLKNLRENGNTYSADIDGISIKLYQQEDKYYMSISNYPGILEFSFCSTWIADYDYLVFDASCFDPEIEWKLSFTGTAQIKEEKIILSYLHWGATNEDINPEGYEHLLDEEVTSIIGDLYDVDEIVLIKED